MPDETGPLTIPVILTAECYRDHALYEPLLARFCSERASEMLESSTHTVTNLKTGESRTMSVWEYLDHEDRRYPLDKVQRRLRVFAMAERLANLPYGNATPRYLRDSLAPLFFRTFPKGQIWYVALDDATWSGFCQRQLRFGMKHRRGSRLRAFDDREVQPFSGLPPDSFPYYSLIWPATSLFPYVLFAVAPVMGGFFLLFPDPMPRYDGWGDSRTLRTVVEGYLSHVYGDRREPTASARSVVPPGMLTPEMVCEYARWWVRVVSRRWQKLAECKSDRTLMLGALTLNRLLVEATLLNTSFTHFQRKVLFFQVLDKAAALVSAARGNVGQKAEVEVWWELVSRPFVRTRLAPFVARIPGTGTLFTPLVDWVLDSLHFDKLPPRVLRAYRNSAHGYNIRNAEALLRHGEQIDNDLPDLATAFVFYLIGSKVLNGLGSVELS